MNKVIFANAGTFAWWGLAAISCCGNKLRAALRLLSLVIQQRADAGSSDSRLAELVLLPVVLEAVGHRGGGAQWSSYAALATLFATECSEATRWIGIVGFIIIIVMNHKTTNEESGEMNAMHIGRIAVILCGLHYVNRPRTTDATLRGMHKNERQRSSSDATQHRILATGACIVATEWFFTMILQPCIRGYRTEMRHTISSTGLIGCCCFTFFSYRFLRAYNPIVRMAMIVAGTFALLESVIRLQQSRLVGSQGTSDGMPNSMSVPVPFTSTATEGDIQQSWELELKSISWLIDFLLRDDAFNMPRYSAIIYWSIVLIVSSICVTSLQAAAGRTSITVRRKWFHLIAILLFAPTTYCFPQTLSLSYAIAIAVLVAVEEVRRDIPQIQAFFDRYLDTSKDASDGVLVSHIALVFGCAIPLWISECVHADGTAQSRGLSRSDEVGNSELLGQLHLLQLWGILCLGVGDSFGAVIGSMFGKHRWGRNRRTLEGSAAMWCSMVWVALFCVVDERWEQYRIVLVATSIVTVLEAFSTQVDNLILPLAGVSVILFLQR